MEHYLLEQDILEFYLLRAIGVSHTQQLKEVPSSIILINHAEYSAEPIIKSTIASIQI